jgi:hypothetical protein
MVSVDSFQNRSDVYSGAMAPPIYRYVYFPVQKDLLRMPLADHSQNCSRSGMPTRIRMAKQLSSCMLNMVLLFRSVVVPSVFLIPP